MGQAPPAKKRRAGRKDSVDHIPRPPNAFMLYRQEFVRQRHVPGSIETSHHSLSRIVGQFIITSLHFVSIIVASSHAHVTVHARALISLLSPSPSPPSPDADA